MFKSDLIVIREFVIGWILAVSFWVTLRTYGVILIVPVSIEPLHAVRMVLVFGPLAGILFGTVVVKLERYFYRRVPLWKLGVIGLLLNSVVMSIIYLVGYNFFKNIIGFTEEISFSEFIRNPNAILLFFYSLIVNFLLTSLRQINLLLGKGNLWRFIKGDFYTPRVENRVFMFIDLKGSTTIAEKLGHIHYSQFIQDCFFDLRVVQRFDAEVYQYVGDEVVLSWKCKANMNYNNCLKAFWAFEDQLLKRSKYYFDKYGIQPYFKAGVSEGEVTTSEVGEIKKEIAYHGDTINITSRIQEMCNTLNRNLLSSEFFLDKIKDQSPYNIQFECEETLRGKMEKVKVYSVNRK
jgi:adenylate cyclase